MLERSDWDVLLDNRRFTVQVPEPLNMTDTEIVEWLAEHCDSLKFVSAAQRGLGRGGYEVVYDFGEKAFSHGLRGAVGLAAACQKEANE